MKVTIINEKLKDAVGVAERVVSKNITLPILNDVLLRADKNKITISATNLELGIHSWLVCKVDQEGEVAIPAKIFSGIVSSLSSEKIEISILKDNSLSIKSGSYKGELKGHNPADFPIIPKPQKNLKISLNAFDFKKAIESVVSFTSTSETRPEITGILLNKSKNEDSMEVVSTDSFRLAEYKIFLNKEYKNLEFSVIIPQKTAVELIRIIQNEEDIDVIIDKNQISFTTEKNELISRLIEGTYPDYSGFVPTKFTSEFSVNKDEFIKTIRLVSLMSSRINDIHLKSTKKNLELTANDPDLGENTSLVPIDLSGDSFQISFNWRYLLEGLQQAEGKRVTIKIVDNTKPTLIKSNEENYYVYLVMPIRV